MGENSSNGWNQLEIIIIIYFGNKISLKNRKIVKSKLQDSTLRHPTKEPEQVPQNIFFPKKNEKSFFPSQAILWFFILFFQILDHSLQLPDLSLMYDPQIGDSAIFIDFWLSWLLGGIINTDILTAALRNGSWVA